MIVYNLSERWVGHNRNPENIVREYICYAVCTPAEDHPLEGYKISDSQHEMVVHNDNQYSLAMALTNNDRANCLTYADAESGCACTSLNASSFSPNRLHTF